MNTAVVQQLRKAGVVIFTGRDNLRLNSPNTTKAAIGIRRKLPNLHLPMHYITHEELPPLIIEDTVPVIAADGNCIVCCAGRADLYGCRNHVRIKLSAGD